MFHTPSEPVTAAAWVGIWLIKRRALLIQQFDIKLEEDLKVEGKGAGREGHERKYRFHDGKVFQIAKENLIPGRLLSSTGNSASCLDLCKKWLKSCLESDTHSACGNSDQKLLPTRVIDVGLTDEGVRLNLTKQGQKGKWFTLSWCWGGAETLPPKLQMEDTGLPEPELYIRNSGGENVVLGREFRIPFDALPPVFQDAIHVTRELGEKYIWIDPLCIIQNSTKDWVEHSALMGDIYRDSILCISADAASNCGEGIFEPSQNLRNQVLESYKVQLPYFNSKLPRIEGMIYSLCMASKDALSVRSCLGERAWTFQESALSPRELIWTKLEVEWHCRTAHLSEKYPSCEMEIERSKADLKRDLAHSLT